MKIKRKDLELIFARLIEKLRKEGREEIEVKTDMYRFLDAGDWVDFSSNELLIGSLKDDLDELTDLVANEKRFCTYVDFDRVAFLLRAISQESNAS